MRNNVELQDTQRFPEDLPRPLLALVGTLLLCLLVGALIAAWPTAAEAQEDAEEAPAEEAAPAEEGGDDELDLDAMEEPVAEVTTSELQEQIAELNEELEHIRFLGRFDAVYELTNPLESDQNLRKHNLTSYHQFLMVMVKASDKVQLFGEVVDRTFFELKYKAASNVELRAGKILVPFGAPGFHRFYGGVQGPPTTGYLLPNVWGEYGASVTWNIGSLGPVSFSSESYIIRGFFEDDPASVIALNRSPSGNQLAGGERIGISWGNLRLYASGLYQEYARQRTMLLYGVDGVMDYGFVPLPVVKDIRVKAGFARADVENLFGGRDNDYYKWGDYVEVGYGGVKEYITPRLRYGTYIDDSRVESVNDTHTWSASAVIPFDAFKIIPEYLWQMEEVDEVDNDLFRVMVALDF